MSSTSKTGGSPPDTLVEDAQPAQDTSVSHEVAVYMDVQNGEEFADLRHSHRSFAFPMTVAFCVWYMTYVLLSIYAKGFMSKVLFGSINVALVLGVLQFITTFGIAWYYAKHAGTHMDPKAEKIKADVEARIAAGAEATEDAR